MGIEQRCDGRLMAFPENTTGRDFVAGDLHGQYRLLMAELDELGFDGSKDRLFLLGDLIDRGPESYDCLHLPYQPWCFSVLGNHEEMMLRTLVDEEPGMATHWFRNGGKWILDEDLDDLAVVARGLVANLPLAIEVPFQGRALGLIHAGVTSGVWGRFNPQRDVWTRDLMEPNHDWDVPDNPFIKGIDVVAVGHTIREGVTVRGNVVGMDLGAARGNVPAVWEVPQLFEALDAHLRSGKVTTEYKPLRSEQEPSAFLTV